MASGSQKWNGSCALLVKQPTRIRPSATGYSGSAWICAPRVSSTDRSKLPPICPSTTMPASITSPPPPVTASAMRAPARDSSRPPQ